MGREGGLNTKCHFGDFDGTLVNISMQQCTFDLFPFNCTRAPSVVLKNVTDWDTFIDAHWLKIQGRGYWMFLPKFLGGGVKGFRKNCQGVSTYFAFYCIFINKFFENLPGGWCCFIPPPPPLPPCVHLCTHWDGCQKY